MVSTNAALGLTLTVRDQVSQTLKSVDRQMVEMGRTSAATAKHVGNLDKVFGSLAGRIKAGIQWNVIYAGIRKIEEAINGVIHAIPDLIERGKKWAATVHEIANVTGMATEKASELAAVQTMLGGTTESLSKAMVQLTRNAGLHPEIFRAAGVAIHGTNGKLLDAYDILQNLRTAASNTKVGIDAFARSYTALGRGTREVIDLIKLSSADYAILAQQAGRAGLIMTETEARNAEALRRTQGILDATITGLGTQILGGVAPALESLVNGVSAAIQNNMAAIVSFAVQVVGTLAGLIGGLLGIDFNLKTLAGSLGNAGNKAKDAAKGMLGFSDGTNAATDSINRQIEAIDRQLQRMDRQASRQDARDKQRKLLEDISKAQAELDEIRGNTVFAAGMSDTEAILARQAQAANIISGEKRLNDARKALAKERRDEELNLIRQGLEDQRSALQKQVAAHAAAMKSMSDSAGGVGKSLGDSITRGVTKASAAVAKLQHEMIAVMRDAMGTGQEWAKNLKDLFFGAEHTTRVGGKTVFEDALGGKLSKPTVVGGRNVTTRDDNGLLGHLRRFIEFVGPAVKMVGDAIGGIADFVSQITNAIGSLTNTITTEFGKLVPVLQDLPGAIEKAIRSILPGWMQPSQPVNITPPRLPPPGAPPYGSPGYAQWVRDHPGAFAGNVPMGHNRGRFGGGSTWEGRPANIPSDFAHGPRNDDPGNRLTGAALAQALFGSGGAGRTPGVTSSAISDSQRNQAAYQSYRRANSEFLGPDSDLLRSQQDALNTSIGISDGITTLNDTLSPWGDAITNLGTMVSKHDVLIGDLDKVDAAHDKLLGEHSTSITNLWTGLGGLGTRVDGVINQANQDRSFFGGADTKIVNQANQDRDFFGGAIGGIRNQANQDRDFFGGADTSIRNQASQDRSFFGGADTKIVNQANQDRDFFGGADTKIVNQANQDRLFSSNAVDTLHDLVYGPNGTGGSVAALGLRIDNVASNANKRVLQTDFNTEHGDRTYIEGLLANNANSRVKQPSFDTYKKNQSTRDSHQNTKIAKLWLRVFGNPIPPGFDTPQGLVPEFASGGRITGPSIVGERGPELLSANGTITSNDQLRRAVGGGGGTTNVNVYLDGRQVARAMFGSTVATSTTRAV